MLGFIIRLGTHSPKAASSLFVTMSIFNPDSSQLWVSIHAHDMLSRIILFSLTFGKLL